VKNKVLFSDRRAVDLDLSLLGSSEPTRMRGESWNTEDRGRSENTAKNSAIGDSESSGAAIAPSRKSASSQILEKGVLRIFSQPTLLV
jgi:hypothetical protein